jgi:hypothetical protein
MELGPKERVLAHKSSRDLSFLGKIEPKRKLQKEVTEMNKPSEQKAIRI